MAHGGEHMQPVANGRFTRLTNAFSKKAENHAYAVALHFMHYNHCRIHQTLRITPAMAANLVASPWTVDDIVALVEKAEAEAAPKKRGPYKPRKKDISVPQVLTSDTYGCSGEATQQREPPP
ncbi:MAG: hypothetical protein COC12_03120 [Rhodobacteraceae bacterium]|nr:MAG: hypothetical protein COC12_03120 [Paracoccaceae bacterium]